MALLAWLCVQLSGCACTDRDHMATTNWVDRKIVPSNRAAQWAMTPLLVPLGVGTLALDNVLMTPVVHLPSAWYDADRFFRAEAGGYYTEMGVLPVRTALTPVVCVGSWLGRSFFAVKPQPDVAWQWPEWGVLWVRDEDGRLLGPSTQFDPKTKEPRPPEPAEESARGS